MASRLVIPGQKQGRLTILEEGRGRYTRSYVRIRTVSCQCDCGRQTEIDLDSFLRGTTRSCGCLRREQSAENMRLIHDMHSRIAALETENAQLQELVAMLEQSVRSLTLGTLVSAYGGPVILGVDLDKWGLHTLW